MTALTLGAGNSASAELAGLYRCATTHGDFQYYIDTRSKTVKFNDFKVMPYTRLLSRDAEEAAQYNVLFDAAVDVPRQYFPQYDTNHLTLFGSEATGVFLTETFTSGMLNRNGSDLSLTDLEQVSRGIPCQSTRR